MLSKLDDTEDNPIEVDRRTGTPRNTGTWGLIEQVHGIIQKPIRLPDLIYTNADNTGADARDKAITRLAEVHYEIGVFITAVPMTKLFAWGEGDSGGHVLRERTNRPQGQAVATNYKRHVGHKRRPQKNTSASNTSLGSARWSQTSAAKAHRPQTSATKAQVGHKHRRHLSACQPQMSAAKRTSATNVGHKSAQR